MDWSLPACTINLYFCVDTNSARKWGRLDVVVTTTSHSSNSTGVVKTLFSAYAAFQASSCGTLFKQLIIVVSLYGIHLR